MPFRLVPHSTLLPCLLRQAVHKDICLASRLVLSRRQHHTTIAIWHSSQRWDPHRMDESSLIWLQLVSRSGFVLWKILAKSSEHFQRHICISLADCIRLVARSDRACIMSSCELHDCDESSDGHLDGCTHSGRQCCPCSAILSRRMV